MGWLFACFGGTTNKRKRPRKGSKFGPKSRVKRRIQSYQPLKSDVPQELRVSEPVTSSNLELRDETMDEKKARIKKKVRFNLDVITYEPIPRDDDSNSQGDEGDNSWDEIEEDDEQAASEVCLIYMPHGQSYSSSSSHRYNNWYGDEDEYNGVDEEEDEDVESGVSDLDDSDDDDCYGDCRGLIDPQKIYHEEIAEEHQDLSCMPLTSSGDDLKTSNDSTKNIRFRSHYIVPVLNPIENLSQWKALKRKKRLSHA